MTRISRRDYLTGMAATAGALSGAGHLDLFAQGQRHVMTTKEKELAPRKLVSSLGSTQSVRLIFHGSIAISRGPNNTAVVGFHSTPTSKHKHQLDIRYYKRTPQCSEIYPPELNVDRNAILKFEVDQPDVLSGAAFFQPPMIDGMLHENDFRALMNLEGPDWYNDTLTKLSNIYNPALVIPNGLFHTLTKTRSTFIRLTPDGNPANIRYIGPVAEIIAANVYLKTGGQVRLTVGAQQAKVFRQDSAASYEIHFINTCSNSDGSYCTFNPNHATDETERNDFYMHRLGVDLTGKPQYQLFLLQKGTADAVDICGVHRISDEAPCSGVGYGGPGGFPPFP